MKRNVVFFLDLIVQVLAIMIIMTSLAARQGSGVGLVKPANDYRIIEATYSTAIPDGVVGDQADRDAVSVLCVRKNKVGATILFAARKYLRPNPNADDKFTIKVPLLLLSQKADQIVVSRPTDPTLSRSLVFSKISLGELNGNDAIHKFVEFVK